MFLPARPPFAVLWAPVYAGFAVNWLALDVSAFSLGTWSAPTSLNCVSLVAAGAILTAFVRDPRSVLSRWLFRLGAVLLLVSAFGLLMDLITLTFNQRVDQIWPAVNHALGFLGLCALGPWLHDGSDGTRRQHRPTDPDRVPKGVVVTAWIGAGALLPYVGMKATWAVGGTFAGTTGMEMRTIAEQNGASELWLTLERYGVDATVVLALLGVLLLVALLRPWGRRVPRWVLLGPAVAGAATLVPYGVVGLGYTTAATVGWVGFPRGDFPTVADALLVSWIGLAAFAGFGVALAVAGRSYWQRTRTA